jgi:acetylornithine/succinyldiaminopimelate/putrescine aminotransferase
VSRATAHDLWRRFVNPDFVELLEALGFGRCFVRAEGARLTDDAGRKYLDLLAGFGVHNVGHNHPRVVAALRAALESRGASMLNVDAPEAAGRLAEKLSALTHPSLCRASFANSGAEAVEMAIKAAWAATGRRPLLACRGGYHGLTSGALALMGDEEYRRPFGKLPVEAEHVAFGDAAALAAACERLKPAAFVVEPVQAEGGINVPADGYLAEAARICRKADALLVVDEIQTGLGRTGATFATDFRRVAPDVLLVGKALSGGLVPAAAAIMTDDVWKRAFSGPERCLLNASTFAGGLLAMTAGLETLKVIEEEKLAARAAELGAGLLPRLKEVAARHEVIADVRGRGLLIGVELKPAAGLAAKAIPVWARSRLHAQVICLKLLAEHGMLAQTCTLAPNVLRVEPPLVIGAGDLERFPAALDQVLRECPSVASAAVTAIGKRIFGNRD